MNKEFDIQQLVSYLTGNCSQKEQELVEQWIALSKDNMLLFDELKRVWNSSSIINGKHEVNVEKAWAEFKLRTSFEIKSTTKPVEVSKPKTFKRIFYYASRVAALAIIVFGLYFLLDKSSTVEMQNYSASNFTPDDPIMLPDGSSVVMNKGARINYPEEFSSETRDVSFKGEAFFNIAHNPNKPMVIATGDVRVKVLGTSFDLCNCINSDEITVYLESGKILFYSIDEIDGSILEQIILYPGQKGVYNKNTGLITKHRFTDKNHVAWKTGVLEFVNAPLPEVVKVLEHTYQIQVNSDINLADYQLTARFNNESTGSIFESLQVIYGFDYKIEDDLVVIY
ncbi:MAG: FecR domain-containing protein [Bacteroidota bacterium]